MDWSNVAERIEAGEGRRTELKRGLGDLSAVGKFVRVTLRLDVSGNSPPG